MPALCRKHLPETVIKNVFVPTYDSMRRYDGAWHMERKALFPSHVILESEAGAALEEAVRQCMGLLSARNLLRMNQEETNFLKSLCGNKHHLKMSKGIIRQGSTRITDGPLIGMEKQICRIDRHKRLARLCTPQGQNVRYIPAGLEIIEKSI